MQHVIEKAFALLNSASDKKNLKKCKTAKTSQAIRQIKETLFSVNLLVLVCYETQSPHLNEFKMSCVKKKDVS